MTRDEVETTCRVLAEKMAAAQVEEAEHDGKERLHRTLKEAARSKRDALRSVIIDLDPDFFGAHVDGGVTDKPSTSAETTRPLGKDHKSRYGQWAKIAHSALRSAGGSGTFQELRDIARKSLVAPDVADDDMEGLRGALHGLRRRSAIGYKAGKDGAGGVFFELDEEDDKD
jgi:hypothetical protein